MNRTLILAAIATAAAAAFVPGQAQAQVPDAERGVTCRAGTDALYDNGVLRCRAERTVTLQSICSAVDFKPNGDIVGNHRVLRLETAGVDQCVGLNGARADSLMRPPVPGVDPAATPGTYRRVVDPNGADVFVATQVTWEFPQGGGLNFAGGDPQRGVACPGGFDPERRDNGRTLRCVKQEVRMATCDGGYEIQRRSGTDRCIKRERDFLGNLHTTVGQYTIPANAGYIGLAGNPAPGGRPRAEERNLRVAGPWRLRALVLPQFCFFRPRTAPPTEKSPCRTLHMQRAARRAAVPGARDSVQKRARTGPACEAHGAPTCARCCR
jgi:hypothetical protein